MSISDPISDLDIQTERTVKYVASRIRRVRRERNMTVQNLAWYCGMERSNMSRIEAGRTNPTVRTLCAISFALRVPIRTFFPESATAIGFDTLADPHKPESHVDG